MTVQQLQDEKQEPQHYTPQRPMGLLEKYQLSNHLTGGYGAVTTTALLRHEGNPWETSTTEASLKQFYLQKLAPALDKLVRAHPQLSLAVLHAAEPTASFVHLSSVELDKILSLCVTSFWETDVLTDMIEGECRREFNLESLQPLWRLRLCLHPERPGQCTITLAVHHVIADGMSLAIFWQDLLKHLNQEMNAVTSDDHVIQYSLEPGALAEPMEKRGAPTFSALDYVRTIRNELAKKILPLSIAKHLYRSLDSWQGDAPANPDAPHYTRLRLVEFGGDHWQSLIQHAKRHGVSLHAVVYTAIMFAWRDSFGQAKSVTGITPINARKFCSPAVPANEMGNFLGVLEKNWKSASLQKYKDTPWVFAKKYHQCLQKNKPAAVKKMNILRFLQRYPADYTDYWMSNHKTYRLGRSGGVELSDLGRFAVENKSGPWTLDGLWFSQSAQVFALALGVSAVTTNGVLRASIQWQKHGLQEDKVERFATQLMHHLEAMALDDKSNST